jgi:hypothetical protein
MTDGRPDPELDALLRLQHLHVDRFNERRQWEWRVALALWAGLGLAANALRGAEIPVWLIWLAAGTVVGLHWFFEAAYVAPHGLNNHLATMEVSDVVYTRLGLEKPDLAQRGPKWLRPNNPDHRGYNPLTHYWQVAVTAVFVLVVVAAVVWGAPAR